MFLAWDWHLNGAFNAFYDDYYLENQITFKKLRKQPNVITPASNSKKFDSHEGKIKLKNRNTKPTDGKGIISHCNVCSLIFQCVNQSPDKQKLILIV